MRTKYILLVVLQALFLVGMIGMKQAWIARGEKIKLKTVPVDPRDIFRGDYARLNYDISSLDLDSLGCKETFQRNDKVYVAISKGDKDYYEAVSVSSKRPAEGLYVAGKTKYGQRTNSKWEVSVKTEDGTMKTFHPQWFYGMKKDDTVVFCIDRQGNVQNSMKENAEHSQKCYGEEVVTVKGVIEEVVETKYQTMDVQYGIESYFVEEGKGRIIESAPRSSEVLVEISLNKKGKGLITGLYIDGKRY
ncbi:MAG TPA: GDYXXLXY domain-containing protein [Acidobacteriota bacterium]|nr:GDYXXLXY domain-containing protein [Acidobacteriota bacterium]HNT18176.1 GDYXXLXY domain-containing protein [Acidobacteriota bacterium]HPA28044.1 GDYXXLXY domain-containing protein [Acidobacteriota bacterium]HQO19911.1 GDYXXLXY domain-containing protein [Acidobacteriota bacterium]HQQ46958.1 GDYXXLXY domain-containing protein [Acidobacteriota bacterium]